MPVWLKECNNNMMKKQNKQVGIVFGWWKNMFSKDTKFLLSSYDFGDHPHLFPVTIKKTKFYVSFIKEIVLQE